MQNYSQNNEQEIILNFFKDFKGTFLDIGANDGITLSNTHALALNGWNGLCVEASPNAFKMLLGNYLAVPYQIQCINVAIDDYNGEATFYESGEHLGTGDTALLSTLNEEELKRWEGSNNKFTKTHTSVWDFATLQKEVEKIGRSSSYDFISIDVEGNELKILPQMDLKALGCKMICVEFNGKEKEKYDEIIVPQGYSLIHQNAENLIYTVGRDENSEPTNY